MLTEIPVLNWQDMDMVLYCCSPVFLKFQFPMFWDAFLFTTAEKSSSLNYSSLDVK